MGAISLRQLSPAGATLAVVAAGDGRRAATEAFIRAAFARNYGARVTSFAPELVRLEHNGIIAAAAGWRGGDQGALYLERYLDVPVEQQVSRLAGYAVPRDRIVEVGNLAAGTRGGGAGMILAMAAHLDGLGYEWVVFTATRELLGIFNRMALPPLALAPADPLRLGEDAKEWGSYYDTQPVVVAGRIRLAQERMSLAEASQDDL